MPTKDPQPTNPEPTEPAPAGEDMNDAAREEMARRESES